MTRLGEGVGGNREVPPSSINPVPAEEWERNRAALTA